MSLEANSANNYMSYTCVEADTAASSDVRVVQASLQLRHETLHPMPTSSIPNTLPKLDILASDTKLFNQTTCNTSRVASPKEQRSSAVVEAPPIVSFAAMLCMVADCQQTAGSNPLRAAGKAAGVQLGWWRAGTVLLCLAHVDVRRRTGSL